MTTVLALTGFILTVASFAIAIIQTLKNRQLKEALARINRHDEAELWAMIGIVVKTFESMDSARIKLMDTSDVDPVVLSKLQSARRGTIDQYKHLLKEASLLEENYNLGTVKKWIMTGRLENEWRVEQALRLLSTNASPEAPISAEDLLQENHLAQAKPVQERPKAQG